MNSAMFAAIAMDHLLHMDSQASAEINKVGCDEVLEKGHVRYGVKVTLNIGGGRAEVDLLTETIPLTYPVKMMGDVLPHVFARLSLDASKMMNSLMEGAFGDDEEDDG